MPVRRTLLLLLACMLLLPVGAFALQSRRSNRTDIQSSQANQVYIVRRGAVQASVSALGKIKANQVGNLSFRVMGQVSEINVHPGDPVKTGDVLIRLADSTQRDNYNQAALTLERANLELQKLLEPVDPDDIRQAKSSVNKAMGAYTSIHNAVTPQDIQVAELAYDQAQKAQQATERASKEVGSLSDNQITLLQAQAGQASFNTEITRLNLQKLKNANRYEMNSAYAQVLLAQAALEQVKAGPSQFEITNARLAIEQKRSALDQAQIALDQAHLDAPFDGFISDINVEVGETIAPGKAVIEITGNGPAYLLAQLDEVDLPDIHEGQPVTIRADALPDLEITGTLQRVSFEGKKEQGVVSYDARIALNAPPSQLRVGMTADATIIAGTRSNVLIVPNTFIRVDRQTNKAYVTVQRPDNTTQEIEIVLGLRGADNSEVISGVQAGDILVARPLTTNSNNVIPGIR